MKLVWKNFLLVISLLILLAACASPESAPQAQPTTTQINSPELQNVSAEIDIDPELAEIIEIVSHGNLKNLISAIEFTQAECTESDGLGGPPKCAKDEVEGDLIAVLPMMGPEGHFLRQTDLENWTGLQVTELYAVYKNSSNAYTEEYYPIGEYAIVFLGNPEIMNITLQVVNGKIVRIDYGVGNPPDINKNNVEVYLIPPPNYDGE